MQIFGAKNSDDHFYFVVLFLLSSSAPVALIFSFLIHKPWAQKVSLCLSVISLIVMTAAFIRTQIILPKLISEQNANIPDRPVYCWENARFDANNGKIKYVNPSDKILKICAILLSSENVLLIWEHPNKSNEGAIWNGKTLRTANLKLKSFTSFSIEGSYDEKKIDFSMDEIAFGYGESPKAKILQNIFPESHPN